MSELRLGRDKISQILNDIIKVGCTLDELSAYKHIISTVNQQCPRNEDLTTPSSKRRKLCPAESSQATENVVPINSLTKIDTFFDLPAEVRNIIYQKYCRGFEVIVESAREPRIFDLHSSTAQDDVGSTLETEPWPLFLSSKRIAYEIRGIFYSSAVFEFKDAQCFVNAHQRALIPGLPQRLPGDIKNFNLLGLLRFIYLDFTSRQSTPSTEINDVNSTASLTDVRLENAWLDALQSISSLEILQIAIEYQPHATSQHLISFLTRQNFLKALYNNENLMEIVIYTKDPITLCPPSMLSPKFSNYMVAAVIAAILKRYFCKDANSTRHCASYATQGLPIVALQACIARRLSKFFLPYVAEPPSVTRIFEEMLVGRLFSDMEEVQEARVTIALAEEFQALLARCGCSARNLEAVEKLKIQLLVTAV